MGEYGASTKNEYKHRKTSDIKVKISCNAEKLDGHYGQARVLNYRYDVGSI